MKMSEPPVVSNPDAPRPWPWWPPAPKPAAAPAALFGHPPSIEDLDLSHGVVLYLDDISVSFDGFKALNDLSLAIDAGELRA